MKLRGFIDLHTHGCWRYDTRTSVPEDILKMAELYGKAGTASFLPTIYPAPIDMMKKNIEAVEKAMKVQKSEVRSQKSNPPFPPLSKGGYTKINNAALILGVHLEGPFLNPARSGALDKDTFIRPSVSSLKKLIEEYEDIIKIMTIAPEIPGALKVIEKCADLGIRVNMGHSEATFKEAESGKRAGASGITHLFNAMRPFHHREPGISGFGLFDDSIYVEVIADGAHLHPETLRFILRTKKHSRIILVSDSVKGTKSGGKPIYEGRMLAGSGMTLAGSAAVLKKLGIHDDEIKEMGIRNPERYLRGK